MTLADYGKLTDIKPPKSDARLKLYDGTVITPVGADVLRCTKAEVTKKINFNILDKAPTSLVSGRAAVALGLMFISHEHLVNVVHDTETLNQQKVLEKYKDVVQGLGKLPGLYHIDIDPIVKPVQNTRRRVAIPIRRRL